jgi:hypothetical protein
MTDRLESELRAALHARAAHVPGAAVARLTGVDYRPRTRRLGQPLALGALASTAAGAGALAVVVSLGAGASNALAGWTSQPTKPAPGQLAGARASCEASQSPIAGLPLKLADTRGPFTFSIYANSHSSATCIKGPSFMAISGSMATSAVDVPDGQIVVSSFHSTAGGPNTHTSFPRRGPAYSFAEGRTGAGVSGVTLVLDDGSKVQATVGGGWFVAWWPGALEVNAAEVTTPAGVATQKLDLARRSPCGEPACPLKAGPGSGSVATTGSVARSGSVTGSGSIRGSGAVSSSFGVEGRSLSK